MNKEKLQEQIDTMREELAKMETELAECEKVELKKGKWFLMNNLEPLEAHNPSESNLKAGGTRATKELAEIASKNMVTRNKLEAYAHQIDPRWRYKGIIERASYIVFIGDKFIVVEGYGTRILGAVYMSESTAETLCEWLNDGRIEL